MTLLMSWNPLRCFDDGASLVLCSGGPRRSSAAVALR